MPCIHHQGDKAQDNRALENIPFHSFYDRLLEENGTCTHHTKNLQPLDQNSKQNIQQTYLYVQIITNTLKSGTCVLLTFLVLFSKKIHNETNKLSSDHVLGAEGY